MRGVTWFSGGESVVANRVERGTIENCLPINCHEGGEGKMFKEYYKALDVNQVNINLTKSKSSDPFLPPPPIINNDRSLTLFKLIDLLTDRLFQ